MPSTNKMAGKITAAIVLALTASVLTQLLLRGKGREKMQAEPSKGSSGRDSYHQWVQGRY